MNTMNERLREFERASGLEIYGLGAKRVPWEAAMERFAELIVRECAEYAEHELDMAGYKKKFMLKHFGVEQ